MIGNGLGWPGNDPGSGPRNGCEIVWEWPWEWSRDSLGMVLGMVLGWSGNGKRVALEWFGMVWDGVGMVGIVDGAMDCPRNKGGWGSCSTDRGVSFGWSAVHLMPPRRRVGVGRGFIFGCSKTAVAAK